LFYYQNKRYDNKVQLLKSRFHSYFSSPTSPPIIFKIHALPLISPLAENQLIQNCFFPVSPYEFAIFKEIVILLVILFVLGIC